MENQRGIAQSLSTALTVETIHLDEIVLEAITKGWDVLQKTEVSH